MVETLKSEMAELKKQNKERGTYMWLMSQAFDYNTFSSQSKQKLRSKRRAIIIKIYDNKLTTWVSKPPTWL